MGLRTKAVEAPCSTSTWGAVALTAGRWVPPLRRPLSRPTRTRTVGGPLMVRHPRPTFVFGDCRSRTHAATRGPARRCPRRHERRARRPARRPPSVSPTAVCRSVRGRGPVYRQAPLHWDLAGCNNTQVVVPPPLSSAKGVRWRANPRPFASTAHDQIRQQPTFRAAPRIRSWSRSSSLILTSWYRDRPTIPEWPTHSRAVGLVGDQSVARPQGSQADHQRVSGGFSSPNVRAPHGTARRERCSLELGSATPERLDTVRDQRPQCRCRTPPQDR